MKMPQGETPLEQWRFRLTEIDRVVTDMERQGIHVDLDLAKQLDQQAAADQQEVHRSDAVGPEMPPNWASPQQLQMFLHTPLGLDMAPSQFWMKGKVRDDEVKTDVRALEWLAAQNPQHREGLLQLIHWRRTTGCRKYFADLETHAIRHGDGWRVHPTFSVAGDADDRAGAITGRFAVKNPPLQQIPSDKKKDRYRIRRCFVAPPGHKLIVADYSQLEVVVLAHLVLRLFGSDAIAQRIAKGAPDVHSATARFVFGEILGLVDPSHPLEWYKADGKRWRDLIKAVRYGLNYGKGSYGFANTLFNADGSALGEVAAQSMIDGLLAFDPDIAKYQAWVREFILQYHGIPSLLGKWCDLSDLLPGREWQENRAWRRALNYPMQSGAQEITAAAMIAINACPRLRRMGAKLILQVHDELILVVPEQHADEALALVVHYMITSFPLDVPLQVSAHTGYCWEEGKK
jgi:DNA polymerase-1